MFEPHFRIHIVLTLCVSEGRSEWSWRKEYALENARWERCDQLIAPPASCAPLMCADLHSNGSYLAVVDEDARVTVLYEKLYLIFLKLTNTQIYVQTFGFKSPMYHQTHGLIFFYSKP